MKVCKACGAEYRKGRVATVLGALGAKPTRGRVCLTCAAAGVLIVPTIRLAMVKAKPRKVPELFACSHGTGTIPIGPLDWCATCGALRGVDGKWALPTLGAS